MIYSLSNDFGFEVVEIVDPKHEKKTSQVLNAEVINKCDVIIDFSTPKVVYENIVKVQKQGVPMVVGTTGWYENIEDVQTIVNENKGSLIFATNFSLGVNIFFKIVRHSASLINLVDGYDIAGSESHHRLKKDIPSGTAKTLADIILQEIDYKESIVYQPGNRQIDKNELHFTSLRCGNITGNHTILMDSKSDQIKISHEANNREGFAKGALLAARFIMNNDGFYDFKNVFESILKGGI